MKTEKYNDKIMKEPPRNRCDNDSQPWRSSRGVASCASHGTYHNDSGGDKPPAKLPPRVRVDVQHFLNVRWEFLIAWNSVNARRVQDTSVQQLLGARMTSRVAWRRSYNCSWGEEASWELGWKSSLSPGCLRWKRKAFYNPTCAFMNSERTPNVRYLHCCFLLTEKGNFSQKNGRYLSQIECQGYFVVYFAAALRVTRQNCYGQPLLSPPCIYTVSNNDTLV